MLSNAGYRRRQIMRDVSDRVEAIDRYVDVGVTLIVVKADDAGHDLIPGARKMSELRRYDFGGIVDTKANPPRILEGEDGLSRNPQVWYCSEDQEKIILHPDDAPVGELALGGMGAGKTTAGVIWVYLRWLEHLGSRLEMGITAPTETRLDLVFQEVFKKFPASWYTYRSSENLLTLCCGFRVRGVSTYQQSDAQGSRIAGFNWVACLLDEMQDQLDQLVYIQARLRSKMDGRAKRLGTATSKDDPAWRTAKSTLLNSGVWSSHMLLGPNSPFIHPNHWEAMKRQMTERDFQRLVYAEDLPSESRLYHTFDRRYNLRPIPLGARKITSLVLRRRTNNDLSAVAMGHDPGTAKAATVWADAYELSPGIAARHGFLPNEVIWWIRAELFTLHKTTEQHAVEAMKITRTRFGVNVRPDGERAHVRCQPLGSAEDKPDLSTFGVWRRVGFDIRAAQYSKDGQGIGQIKKNSRIDVVNTLFCDAAGRRRMYLECDDRGTPMTPQLLAALETMERDHKGRAEHEEKDVRHDKSDLPAAMGYMVWPFEKELAIALRADIRNQLG